MNGSPIVAIPTDIQTSENEEERFAMEKSYTEAIARAGGIPILFPSLIENKTFFANAVARIHGLLLPGGKDMDPALYHEKPHPLINPARPERTKTEIALLELSHKRNLPILGICGGMQIINVFFSGTLYQDIQSLLPDACPHMKGSPHEIIVKNGTLLQSIVQKRQFSAKSYHHQAIKTIGKGLRISAKSPDGIIEAIEMRAYPFLLGVQWHPEKENTPVSERIFEVFIDACKEKI